MNSCREVERCNQRELKSDSCSFTQEPFLLLPLTSAPIFAFVFRHQCQKTVLVVCQAGRLGSNLNASHPFEKPPLKLHIQTRSYIV